MSDRETVRSRIRTELGYIDRELDLVRQLNTILLTRSLDRLELHAAASTLHSIYTGIERSILLVVRAGDKKIPSGSNWHQELLRIAEIQRVIDKSLAARLRDLLGFRHFYRHAYGFMLDGDLIAPLLEDIEPLVEGLRSVLSDSIFNGN